ncbi:MAG: glycosyl hydrolase 53 family protein, partial [Lentimicrobiaceae bacterium]|nr:glycosyl hydrolase 53 family protein [Lentimicrobiaceae bacterium]
MKNSSVKTGTAFLVLFLLVSTVSCKKEQVSSRYGPSPETKDTIIRGADLSFLPEIEANGVLFSNSSGKQATALEILAEAGMNTVRLRLWHSPENNHSSLAEVKLFADRIKAMRLKLWITVHYSDTWADPGHQQKPAAWNQLSLQTLRDSVYIYTSQVVRLLKPDILQVGNEINHGFLWPDGHSMHREHFLQLLEAGCKAVRDHSDDCLIMLHYAGFKEADIFFNEVNSLDYDLMGISYYPIWHGKDLNLLQSSISALSKKHQKKLVIAETAYPFTLQWNDHTHNVLGEVAQTIAEFSPSPDGQQLFLEEIKRISTHKPLLSGFAYWGAEWIAFKGAEATDGSSWENQALFDFSNKALPAISAFAR